MFSRRFKPFFVLLIIGLGLNLNIHAQATKSEEDLKKEAEKLFEEDEFSKAYTLYSQLVSNYPKDPEYNYRLGVCMLYSEPDKSKCFSYLKFAANHPKDAPKDATFYLAKAYHINYKFDEAIELYNKYKTIGSSGQQKKLQVDREILACNNGKRLLATMSDLIVMSKKQLNEADYFRSYDLTSVGGKLLVKPDDFKSGYDKKKKDKSVIYVTKNGDRFYFSSYGENGEKGRDIYVKTRLSNGTFGQAQRLPINTDFDEDYPFMHPDGRTLYFSSKGFNSMGGYDIFKSTYNPDNETWSIPVNMEFPINSPDDDYLFITDMEEKIAYFSTGRQSPPGKIDVLKVNIERVPMEVAIIKGTVVKESADQSLKSKITVKNMDNGQVVGVFSAKDNGDYYMEVPNGGKFIFTVETPGIPTQSDKVAIPMANSLKPFKQSISYDKKVLKILNYFDTPPDDMSYLQYMELIEKKAKLDVNEGKLKTPTLLEGGISSTAGNENVANSNTNTAVTTTNPTIINDGSEGNNVANNSATDPKNNTSNANTNSTKGLTNTQLVEIAQKDAQEAEVESKKMNQDAKDAFEIGEAKKIEADKLQKEADDAIAIANAITDETKKKEELAKAIELKNNADNATNVASTVISLAKNLEADAKNKEKEVAINQEYAKELENVTKNPNNKESLAKLNDLQKQIEEISKQKKQSDEQFKAIKNEYDQKQGQVASLEEKSTSIKNEIGQLQNEISLNENESKNTKDKSLRKTLEAQNKELKTDLESKNNALVQNEQQIAKVKGEAKALQNEIDIVNTVKTTDSATNVASNNTNNTTNSGNTSGNNGTPISNNSGNTTNPASNELNYANVNTKYNDQINAISNADDKQGLEQKNAILTNYNKEINDLIALNKVDLKAASTPEEKKKINDELKKLETQKKTNTDLIAANNKKIKQGGTSVATNNNTASSNSVAANNTSGTNASNEGNTNTTPAVSDKSVVDMNFDGSNDLNKLNDLKDKIESGSNSAFAYNGYKDAASIDLKKQADDKLQAMNASKTELSNSITKAQDDIKSKSGTISDPAVIKDKINAEADEIAGRAKDKRIQAADKTGPEKDAAIAEAKQLDAQANQKYLEATDVTKNQNKSEFDVNTTNINALLATNKSAKADVNEAQKLIDEAKTNFKQASSIRQEADQQTNAAAKLGIVSNAEEKEAEALNKQKKAVDLLLKGNAGFALKSAEVKATASPENMNAVTQQFNKLNNDKIDAYMTLSKANQTEIKALSDKLNQTVKNNKEASDYKKQSDDLNKEAMALISKALTEPDANAKQDFLMQANKKEIASISALNKADAAVSSTTPTDIAANNNNAGNNTGGNQNNNSGNEAATTNNGGSNTTSVTTNAGNENATNTNTVSINTNTVSTTSANNAANENATNTNTVSATTNTFATTTTNNNGNENSGNANTTTTSTATNPVSTQTTDPVSAANTAGFKNPEAATLKTNAENSLKALDEEIKKIEAEISASPSSKATETEVKDQINALEKEADEYSQQATALRKEAADKTGPEKDKLTADARELQGKSSTTKLKASDVQKSYNEAQFTAYNESISGLLEKAKSANAAELPMIQEMLDNISTYKKQAQNIRDEANGLPNAAKLGAYSNAEEKELEMFNKQLDVIGVLRKYDPAFIPKEPTVTLPNTAASASPELKQKYEEVLTKQSAELENITKANVMEYESTNAKLPGTLTEEQKTLKDNADQLITESKNLVTKAGATTVPKEKKDLLSTASKKGQEAVALQNRISTTPPIAANTGGNTTPRNNTGGTTTPRNNTNAGNNTGGNNAVATNTGGNTAPRNNTPRNNTPRNNAANTNAGGNNAANTVVNNTRNNATTNPNPTPVKINGLEVKTSDAYSPASPIPLDQKIPDGLVFRVQIGAFKTAVANDAFKGLTPLNGQTTPNGYIRYTAGNFEKYEEANGVKNDLKNLGYNDAFVVVYYNGKNITVAEAMDILSKEGKPAIDLSNNNATAGITANANIPRNTAPATAVSPDPVTVTKELEQINGMLYTIQIGVYSKQVRKSQLSNLLPIYTERLPNGLYRYTAGIYNNKALLSEHRQKVNDLGIKDAFASAYFNGRRIPFTDAEKMRTDSANLRMEPENPIIFPAGGGVPAATTNAVTPTTTPVNTGGAPVTPFTNNVATAPAPTPENGVKEGEDGVAFKVQIGAYKNQVPAETASKFLNIKTWPVAYKQINGLFIYTVGNFVNVEAANKLRAELVALGITDAFVSVYRDGKKLYGAERAQLMGR
jgi:hypothetical protein